MTAIEAVVGVAIAGLILVYSMQAISNFINGARTVVEKTEALYLAEEGLELLRFVRDRNWSTFAATPTNTTRYLSIGSTAVTITTTPEVIGNFTRSIQTQVVRRDAASNDIVQSGGIVDNDSRYVVVTVSGGTLTHPVSLTSLLTNLDP